VQGVPCILQAYMGSPKMISELKSKISADYSKLDIEKKTNFRLIFMNELIFFLRIYVHVIIILGGFR